MIPASGVLNAAAIPAAPPATSSEWALMPLPRGSQRRAASITPAAIWTDGPSRPSDRPPSKPADVRPILAKLIFRDTSRGRRPPEIAGSSAAITCGMPEPPAPRTKRRVTQTMAAHRSGVQIRGTHQAKSAILLNWANADSASQVNATTTRPAMEAVPTTTMRVRQRLAEMSSRLKAERTSCGEGSWDMVGSRGRGRII